MTAPAIDQLGDALADVRRRVESLEASVAGMVATHRHEAAEPDLTQLAATVIPEGKVRLALPTDAALAWRLLDVLRHAVEVQCGPRPGPRRA